MAAILAAVADAGVERRDVRTALLSVQPRYEYRENQPPTLAGYDLANVVEVTVRDLARLGDVVDGTLGPGRRASTSCRSGWPIRSPPNARRACGRWRWRGPGPMSWPRPPGSRIVGVTDIVEGGAPPVPMPRMKAERMMLAADAATPVEAGSMEISVSVTVSYRAR